MSLTRLALQRPVATQVVFLILVVLGIVAFTNLPVDLLPKIEFTQLTVRVRYANVGPQEIETIITDRIENAIAGLPNLERVTSRSEEGSSRVRLEFARGTNIDEAANDLRAAIDRIRDQMPPEADSPEIFKLDLDQVAIVDLVATSTRPLEELTRILEHDVTRRFEQIPGVGTLEVRGGIYRRIRIELDRERLAAAGLTALDVQDAIGRSNVNLPGGNVKSGLHDLYVRPLGEYVTVEEIAATVIRNVDGLPIHVQDVAQVVDGFEDAPYLVEVNGVPSVTLSIQKQSGANTVAVADRIREEAERVNAERPDLHLTVLSDQSEFIRQSIDSVRSSGIWGSLLAILVLYMFLRSRSSTVVIATAIPISIIATFALLYFAGMTLNQMTFGGLALGVGMIIDNAIVVLESIMRKREEHGTAPQEAAAAGTRSVTGAIVASTLTTCVVFLPVVFTRTTTGALFQALALVVVFSLSCSLFVALTLVPLLASRIGRSPVQSGSNRRTSLQRLEGWYTQRLRRALHRRGRVFAVTGTLVAIAVMLWPLIPVELAPHTDADEIEVEIEMAQGTSIAVVREYLSELENRIRAVLPAENVAAVATEVRGGDADIEIKLVPEDRRSLDSSEIADALRAAVDGRIPGAEITVEAQPGLGILRRVFSSGGGEDAVELEIRGWDLEAADALAAEIRRRVERIDGITDVRVRRREGRPVENLVLDRTRIAALGLAIEDVGRAVQANVGGVEAGRFRDGGEEYPIVVQLRPDDRLTGQDLHNVALRAPDGSIIALSSVVVPSRDRTPVRIERVDGQRVTYVTAGLARGVALGDAIERVREELAELAMPPGFAVSMGGEYQEQMAARRDFVIAIVLALVLVYLLMAAQFERWIDPLIIMLAVPVALIGVVPALLLTGTTLNIQSVMGLVMLVGIVVNNAIVLVDAVNLLRREHDMSTADAVIEAGRLRLRPILMTTATTVLGLVPLALGIGPGAEIQAALARVVVGGLLASTLVTLFLIPVAYVTTAGMLLRVRERRRVMTAGHRPAEAAVGVERQGV